MHSLVKPFIRCPELTDQDFCQSEVGGIIGRGAIWFGRQIPGPLVQVGKREC